MRFIFEIPRSYKLYKLQTILYSGVSAFCDLFKILCLNYSIKFIMKGMKMKVEMKGENESLKMKGEKGRVYIKISKL